MYNHQLDTFLAVAQSGSFSLAAKKSYISPSAVIQQINLLEKTLGIQLFLRTNRGIRLTAAGEILQAEAPRLIYQSEQIVKKMRTAQAHRAIRLGWMTGVESVSFFGECLAFRDRNKGIQLELSHVSADGVLADLSRQAFDLCLYMESPRFASFGYAFTRLYRSRQCIVLPPDHPLSGRSVIHVEDMAGQTLALLSPGTLTDNDAFYPLAKAHGIRLVSMENYSFANRAECYSNRYLLLGAEPLAHQYAPLACVPVAWDIPVWLGLVSITPSWRDLDLMVKALSEKLRE